MSSSSFTDPSPGADPLLARVLHRRAFLSHSATAMTGRISLWSLRCDGVRALTLEVYNAERALVQARGLHNRRAIEPEKAAIERWARQEGIVIRPGVL